MDSSPKKFAVFNADGEQVQSGFDSPEEAEEWITTARELIDPAIVDFYDGYRVTEEDKDWNDPDWTP